MRKTTLIFCLCQAFWGFAFGQFHKGQINTSSIPEPSPHYQEEYTFDVAADTLAWSQQSPGLQVAFGSTDVLYFRSEVPDISQKSSSWQGSGWRGERLNAQILVWSPDTIQQVRFQVNDLVSASGGILSHDNLQLHMVRYVLSNYPYGARNVTCGPGPVDTAYLMPDRLETFERFELPGRTVRPVWLSCKIPAGTEPSLYQGTIAVKSENYTDVLDIKVQVQPQVLPEPHEWKFRLDLWQNPWVVAWYYHVKPWSEEHKVLLKKHLKLYADAGGKYITTYTVHSPWQDNSYMIEETMIDWIRCADGSWKFNYDIFDQYIELAMEVGIDEAITIYTPVPWGNRFRYLDEKSGNYNYAVWPPDSKEFRAFWHVFLDDLKAHLEKKGWFEKTYLGINENPLEYTLATVKVIKDHSEQWKITYAGDWHPELDTLLNDYSSIINIEPSKREVQERTTRGFTTTYYVCCTPPVPNNFVFSPPIEGRWMGWYTAAHGYDGFLRWAYDAWPADPMRDARHTIWPAGDCFLVYPGGQSSIRFEKLREGIVDYEKIRIIRELASKSTDKNVKKTMDEFDRYLTTFTGEHEYDEQKLKEDVKKGKEMLEALNDQLAK